MFQTALLFMSATAGADRIFLPSYAMVSSERERWHVSLVIQTRVSRVAPDWGLLKGTLPTELQYCWIELETFHQSVFNKPYQQDLESNRSRPFLPFQVVTCLLSSSGNESLFKENIWLVQTFCIGDLVPENARFSYREISLVPGFICSFC